MKKNRSCLVSVLVALLVVSCATNKPKIVTRSDCKLFPYGTYKQNVTVKFDKGTFNFKGVMKRTSMSNIIYGLSAFDTTIFKIIDNGNSQLEIKIYNDKLAGKEEKIGDIYKVLGNVLNLEQCINKEEVVVVNKTIEKEDIKIEFREFDDNKIPIATKLFNKNYEVTIRTGYYEI